MVSSLNFSKFLRVSDNGLLGCILPLFADYKILTLQKVLLVLLQNSALVILFPTFCGESYELRFAIRTFPVIVLSTIISQNMVPFSRELK